MTRISVAALGLALLPHARAAIVYQDLPDRVIPFAGANFPINIDLDGPNDVNFGGFAPGGGGNYIICSLYAINPATARVATSDEPPPPFPPSSYDWTYKRPAGYSITSGEPWLDGGITLIAGWLMQPLGYWGLIPWTEGYAGVRFQRQSGTWHHAWLRIGFTGPFNSDLTLFDLAWETEPEAPIVAGAVPGPAGHGVVAALALLGSRRRR